MLEARTKVKNIRNFPEIPQTESEIAFLSQERQETQPDEFKVSVVVVVVVIIIVVYRMRM